VTLAVTATGAANVQVFHPATVVNEPEVPNTVGVPQGESDLITKEAVSPGEKELSSICVINPEVVGVNQSGPFVKQVAPLERVLFPKIVPSGPVTRLQLVPDVPISPVEVIVSVCAEPFKIAP
jgi:hypothetical protein